MVRNFMNNGSSNIKKSDVYKKCIKYVIFLILAAVLVFIPAACGAATKTVKSEDMTITLSKEYQEATLANATWYYTSPDGLAMGIRSTKDDIEKSGLETNSSQDYAAAYIKANNIPGSPEIKTKDGYIYFEYSRKVSGTEYSYITFIYDHDDEFWLVNFACYKELYKEYKSDFFDAAASVKFSEE